MVRSPMRMLLALALLVAAMAVTGAEPEEAAARAAVAWLEVVDDGGYGRAWERASPLFKRQVSRDRWIDAISRFREPFGEFRKRTLRSVTLRDSIPGAPDGEYAVLQFNSEFAYKQAGVETITLMLVGRSWRVSGYFIR